MPLLALPHRLRIPKDLLQFLERPALGLDDRRPHQQPLQRMKDQEDGVHLPANILERDRRRVRVDETRESRHEALKRHALCADLVVEDLGRVEGL